MNTISVERFLRRIMDTSISMAGRDLLRVESVVIDENCDFVLESLVHLFSKKLIQVRGEMKDETHHEGIESTIRNFSRLAGLALGPGLIREAKKRLDFQVGHEFIVDALVESARVVRQLNDSPTPLPENLASFDAKSLKKFEMVVRPDLVNTCIPYQDGIEDTFSERNVSAVIRPDLYAPRPGQVHRFRRDKIIEVRIRKGVTRLYAYMSDDSHEIMVDLEFDNPKREVNDIVTYARRVPYHNLCELPYERSTQLIGLSMGPGFSQEVRRRLGGSSGCTHLVDLILDATRYVGRIR